jgi:hypothetical protein
MTEETVRLQAARARREFMRWIVLMTADLWRPSPATLRSLLGVVQGEYPDVTELELRRELDYLESRELLKVFEDPLGQLRVDLTRYGIDIAQYTVAVEPGIARPPKV